MKEEDPEAWAEGERVGGHEVVRAVGRGGMAVVYEARHHQLGSRSAIKVLLGDRAQRPEVRERFIREGIAVARVRHPNVVRVFDAGEHRGRAYLLMEFIEGTSLRARLAKAPPMAVELALQLLLPVIAAVAAAHDEGVIHRDLKPANIMLERLRDGGTRPVVVDFGIAQLDGPEGGRAITQQGAIVGTPAYLSPEQARYDGRGSPASDQWSTALVLYECLTGRKAFPGNNVLDVLSRVASAHFEAPRALRPDLPEALEAVILRALEEDPARRHRSMRAFGRELLPFASERVRLQWERSFLSDDDLTGVHGVPAPAPIEPAPEAPAATPPPALVPIAPPSPVAPRGDRATRRVVQGAAAAAVAVALAGLSAAVARRGVGARLPPFRAVVEAAPTQAVVTLDGVRATGGRFAREFAADGVAHELVVSAPGCEPHQETFVNAPPTPRVTLRCAAPIAPAPSPMVSAVDAAPAPSAPQETEPPPAARRARHGVRRVRGGRAETAVRPAEAATNPPAVTIGANGTPNL